MEEQNKNELEKEKMEEELHDLRNMIRQFEITIQKLTDNSQRGNEQTSETPNEKVCGKAVATQTDQAEEEVGIGKKSKDQRVINRDCQSQKHQSEQPIKMAQHSSEKIPPGGTSTTTENYQENNDDTCQQNQPFSLGGTQNEETNKELNHRRVVIREAKLKVPNEKMWEKILAAQAHHAEEQVGIRKKSKDQRVINRDCQSQKHQSEQSIKKAQDSSEQIPPRGISTTTENYQENDNDTCQQNNPVQNVQQSTEQIPQVETSTSGNYQDKGKNPYQEIQPLSLGGIHNEETIKFTMGCQNNKHHNYGVAGHKKARAQRPNEKIWEKALAVQTHYAERKIVKGRRVLNRDRPRQEQQSEEPL